MDIKTKRYLIGAIRKIWRWSKERRECLKEAKVGKKSWRCAMCHKLTKEPVVDHVHPVVPTNWRKDIFWDWQEYIDLMFNGDIQVMCKLCHKIKTRKENEDRQRG